MTKDFIRQVTDSTNIIFYVVNRYLDDFEDRKDAVHDIIIKAWNSYPNFRGESKFSTWLYKIAVCHCFDIRRRQHRRREHELEFVRREEEATELNNWSRMYEALKQLTSSERILLFQVYIYRIPYQQLAIRYQEHENTLRVRVHRLKQFLRNE